MLLHPLYSLVRKYELMFQMHPSEIGPTVTLIFCKKDAAAAYEAVVDEDMWNDICNSDLEKLFKQVRDYLDLVEAERKDISDGQ